jgi:tetratricopeptide (TPR) repeat protein
MSETAERTVWTGYATGLVYLCILITTAALAGRQALSHYNAQAAFRSGSEVEADRAVSIQPNNPDAHEIRGMVLLRQKDYAGAAESFRTALSLRPHDYLLWLRLGHALLRTGDIADAHAAYQNAIELAPNYSQPELSMGRMLLEVGKKDEAFTYLSGAARLDGSLYPEVLHHARVAFDDDPQAIEKAVTTDTVAARATVARYLIKRFWMTADVRSFLTSDELGPAEKNGFISYLKYKRNFEVAREVWLSRIGADPGHFDQPIYDGGFENITESDPSGLGWQIDQKMSAVAVARDRDSVHSGENALSIRFAGNVDLRRPIVSQLAYVTPGQRHTLSFFARSTDTVSAGLPAVIVSDTASNATIAASEPLADTKGIWTRYELIFNAPDAPVVLISLQRPTCTASPCPIFGDLSLDDISIEVHAASK